MHPQKQAAEHQYLAARARVFQALQPDSIWDAAAAAAAATAAAAAAAAANCATSIQGVQCTQLSKPAPIPLATAPPCTAESAPASVDAPPSLDACDWCSACAQGARDGRAHGLGAGLAVQGSRQAGIPAARHPSRQAFQQPGIPAARHPSSQASQAARQRGQDIGPSAWLASQLQPSERLTGWPAGVDYNYRYYYCYYYTIYNYYYCYYYYALLLTSSPGKAQEKARLARLGQAAASLAGAEQRERRILLYYITVMHSNISYVSILYVIHYITILHIMYYITI